MKQTFINEHNKAERQVGLVSTILISIWLWLVTFYYCAKAIFTALDKNKGRDEVDSVIRQWSIALVKIAGIKISVKGEFPDVDKRPRIVMCSHASAFDIPVSFVALPGSIRMLAKKELFKIPIFGRALKLCEFVSVDRQNRDQSRQDLVSAKKKMESGITPWIAPEGTRSPDGNLLPFKKGGVHLALQTDAVVIPVVIKDISRVLPLTKFRFNLNQWVEVRIGEPIDSKNYSVDQRNEFSNNMRAQMEQLLEAPLEINT